MKQLDSLFETRSRKLSLYRFSLPFNRPIHFKGNRLTSREGLWLIDHQSDGHHFIGEVCPLPGFSQETLAQCEQQLLTILQGSVGTHFPTNSLLPSVSFALFCLQQKLPWQTHFINLAYSSTLPCIPLLQGPPSDIINRYQHLQYPDKVKLKVARLSVQEDVTILQRLIAFNPAIRFRLDANQQWSAEQYTEFLSRLGTQHMETQHIDYIEEPTASMADNLNISETFKVMIGLDESLLTHTDIPQHPAIKALIIKPTLIGYPSRINALLFHAKQHQLLVSISASFESPIALKQLQCLSQQWQQETNLPISLGLDTLQAFKKKFVEKNIHTTDFEEKYLTQATCLWRS